VLPGGAPRRSLWNAVALGSHMNGRIGSEPSSREPQQRRLRILEQKRRQPKGRNRFDESIPAREAFSSASITGTTRKHIHELIDAPRRRLERVSIGAVVFEVHERIAGSRKTSAECAEMLQNGRSCGA
jgi:hypothetical protein